MTLITSKSWQCRIHETVSFHLKVKDKNEMELITTVGTIIKVIDKNNFHVKLKDGTIVLASMSSKVKYTMTKEISTKDEVAIQMSPFDKLRGRVIYKHPIMNKYFNH